MKEFTQSLVFGIFPTLGFLLAVWLAWRMELKLMPTFLVGYVIWGVGVLILLALKKWWGLG